MAEPSLLDLIARLKDEREVVGRAELIAVLSAAETDIDRWKSAFVQECTKLVDAEAEIARLKEELQIERELQVKRRVLLEKCVAEHEKAEAALAEMRRELAFDEHNPSDAYYNLEGARLDMERTGEADKVVIKTVRRVCSQLGDAKAALSRHLTATPQTEGEGGFATDRLDQTAKLQAALDATACPERKPGDDER